MSDLLKSGLSFGPPSSSDKEDAPLLQPSPPSSNNGEDVSSALSNLDALYKAGKTKELSESAYRTVERFAGDPVALDSIAKWLLREDRAIKDEGLHRACSLCLKSLKSAADETGDVFIAIDLKTELRNRKYECEEQVANLSNSKKRLVEERSAKQTAATSLGESIDRLTETVNKAQRDKTSANERLSGLGSEGRTDFSAVQACASLGFFIVSILLVLDGCSKGGVDAVGGFFLAPIGGAIFGVPAGALVGLIVSLVSSGVKSNNRSQAESLAKEELRHADDTLASAQSEISRLVSEQQALNSRALAIDLEIGRFDEEIEKATSQLKQVDSLIRLL